MKKNGFAGGGLCRILLAALILGFIALPAKAEGEGISWFAGGSILFFLEGNEVYADSMPILPSLGAGFFYPIIETLRLELTLDFYTTHYGFDTTYQRPIPLIRENRVARVLGFVLGFQLARPFEITPQLTFRMYGGIAADIRLVFVAFGLDESRDDMGTIRRETELLRQYFWSSGRWLFPVAGVGVDYRLHTGIGLGLDFRVWMPLYRVWTEEDLPRIEGWRFGPTVRLTFW